MSTITQYLLKNLPDESRDNVLGAMRDYRYGISTGNAAILSVAFGFPLDSIKARMQVIQYNGVLDCVWKTFRQEGIRGFFRGMMVPVLSIGAVRASSLSIYHWTKYKYYENVRDKRETLLNVSNAAFLGGFNAGILIGGTMAPFEFAKTASQLQFLGPGGTASKQKGAKEMGTIASLTFLYKKGGIRFMYTGYSLLVFRDSLGTGIYYVMNDASRYLLTNYTSVNDVLPRSTVAFLAGSIAGVVSWTLVFPLDTIKTKVQRNAMFDEARVGNLVILRQAMSKGLAHFYSGWTVSSIRSVLTHGAMWSLLEWTSQTLEETTNAFDAV